MYERSAHLSFISDWARLTPIVILLLGDRHTSSTASPLLPSIEECRKEIIIYIKHKNCEKRNM